MKRVQSLNDVSNSTTTSCPNTSTCANRKSTAVLSQQNNSRIVVNSNRGKGRKRQQSLTDIVTEAGVEPVKTASQVACIKKQRTRGRSIGDRVSQESNSEPTLQSQPPQPPFTAPMAVNTTCQQLTSTAIEDEVKALRQTVVELRYQLSYVLSFLGIESDQNRNQNDNGTMTNLENSVVGNNIVPSVVQKDMDMDNSSNQIIPPTPSVPLYSTILQNPTVSLSASLRRAVVSAVYTDFEEHDRRSKNVVINGLQTSSADKNAVQELCLKEFGYTPAIVKCQRLGRQQEGRIRPLLVVLKSTTDAEHLVKNAKNLRRSTNAQVRSSVFINADLTKAEASAAYQRRCRRRQLAAAKSSQPTDGTNDSTSPSYATDQSGEAIPVVVTNSTFSTDLTSGSYSGGHLP